MIIRNYIAVILISITVTTALAREYTNVDGFDMEDGIYEIGEPTWKRFREEKRIALVNYYISWCQHCKQFGPVFDRLAATVASTMPMVNVAKIQTDKWKKITEDEDIKEVPLVVLYVNNDKLVYLGDRTHEDLLIWLTEKLKEKLGDKFHVEEPKINFLQKLTSDSCCKITASAAIALIILLLLCKVMRKRSSGGRVEDHEKHE